MFKVLTNGICFANRKRKQLINPVVTLKYKRVCDVDTPVTEFLFGDNLDTKMDEKEKKDKRASKLSLKNNCF